MPEEPDRQSPEILEQIQAAEHTVKRMVQASEEEAMKVVLAVKEHSMQTKALLTDDELRQVVKATLPQAVIAV